jgi:hypothetical protein
MAYILNIAYSQADKGITTFAVSKSKRRNRIKMDTDSLLIIFPAQEGSFYVTLV